MERISALCSIGAGISAIALAFILLLSRVPSEPSMTSAIESNINACQAISYCADSEMEAFLVDMRLMEFICVSTHFELMWPMFSIPTTTEQEMACKQLKLDPAQFDLDYNGI